MKESPKYSEEELKAEYEVVRASRQDTRHFHILYNKYYNPVYRFIWNRINDKELAADIASEVFYKALINLHKYKFQGVPFSAWLFRIAYNEVGQYYRKLKRERVVSLDETSIRGLWKHLSDSEELKINHEDIKLLFEVMQNLSQDEMNLLELRIFEDRQFREVGEIMSITENNAKVKFYRLIEKLGRIYKEKDQS